ncbi:mitochondrial ribosome and complex I assembly factor AltMIEF1 [Leptinotarsa decemlineata]|uniref:mitochondrial ribosome and complex I assembly factor AltMIEF1 n=1 Tax=Leptinotarsa decemlineata TaxID=7539 RepID=UPI003D30C8CD
MTKILPHQVLKLYKQLLRYGENLQLTDKHYFLNRIKQDFKRNKTLTNVEDINFNFEKGTTLLSKRTVQ